MITTKSNKEPEAEPQKLRAKLIHLDGTGSDYGLVPDNQKEILVPVPPGPYVPGSKESKELKPEMRKYAYNGRRDGCYMLFEEKTTDAGKREADIQEHSALKIKEQVDHSVPQKDQEKAHDAATEKKVNQLKQDIKDAGK